MGRGWLKLRVPKPLRWLLVVIAIFGGWAAGDLLDANAQRRQERLQHPMPPTARPSAATTVAG